MTAYSGADIQAIVREKEAVLERLRREAYEELTAIDALLAQLGTQRRATANWVERNGLTSQLASLGRVRRQLALIAKEVR